MKCNRSIRKRILLLTTVAMISSLLSGCALTSEVSVPQEESRLIAEYAAGLLLKYDSKYNNGLERVEEVSEETTKNEEQGIDNTDGFERETPTDSEDTIDATTEGEVVPVDSAVPLGEAMGLTGFDIIYQSYEVCDIYPQEAPDDLFFSMQASPGRDLMVVHFNLTNTSENPQLCDMLNSNILFRLIINGSERINEQTTILLNDLKQYHETVAGYGMVDVVLVFEIEEGAQENFETLQLLVKDANSENTYTLQ